MDDDRLERLLSGYQPPAVSPQFDERVLRSTAAVLERARTRAMVEGAGRTVLQRLGFGYIAWLLDVVTTTDAEYRVEFI